LEDPEFEPSHRPVSARQLGKVDRDQIDRGEACGKAGLLERAQRERPLDRDRMTPLLRIAIECLLERGRSDFARHQVSL
jgi:hypothetical protein